MSNPRERVFKYVPLAHVEAYLHQGWLIADTYAGVHHGEYAMLMEHPFPSPGEPQGGQDDDGPYDDPRDINRPPTADFWSV